MLETKQTTDIEQLEGMNKVELQKISGLLKQQGALETAEMVDLLISNLTYEEVKSGQMPVVSEAEYQNIVSKFRK